MARRASLPKLAVMVANAGSYWVAAMANPVAIQAAANSTGSCARARETRQAEERADPADITARPPKRSTSAPVGKETSPCASRPAE